MSPTVRCSSCGRGADGEACAPSESQRRQAKLKDVGIPFHVPRVATSVTPHLCDAADRRRRLRCGLRVGCGPAVCPAVRRSRRAARLLRPPAAIPAAFASGALVAWPAPWLVDCAGSYRLRDRGVTRGAAKLAASLQRAFREATRSLRAVRGRSAARRRRGNRRRRRTRRRRRRGEGSPGRRAAAHRELPGRNCSSSGPRMYIARTIPR